MESPFRDPVPDGTCLIETFAWVPGAPVAHLDLHLARLTRSAAALGFALDPHDVQAAVASLSGEAPLRCRLTLDRPGRVAISTAPLPPASQGPWSFRIHPSHLDPNDPFLRHKTTRRALYDRARTELPDGVQEWVFLNTRGEVCEGSITNIAFETSKGDWFTPPVACGCLPGVYRQTMLDAGHWREAVLTLADLRAARQIVLTNALRGQLQAMWDASCPVHRPPE
ncbi:aminotransferase class IV family protein [Shimia sp. SDUM112013]|uniref:aminotransferase class IV family protein n=1 Tax=Shimia sp. SDUM112013 TaxID=3136160 RepID=UPI0032F00490